MKTTQHTGAHFEPDPSPKFDGALDHVAVGAHKVVDKAAATANEVVGKAGPAIDRAADYAHHGVNKVVSSVTPATGWITDRSTTLVDTQEKVISGTRAYVAANPLTSVGVAIAAGFLISKVFRD